MASVEHTAHGSGKADSNPASGEITIRRGALLNETSAGIRFKKGKERKGSRESEWVKIDQQTVTEYTNLLDGHIRRLKEVQDANPAVFKDPSFAMEKHLLDIFQDSHDTGLASETKLRDKITDLLGTREGWNIATQALEKAAMDMANTIGYFQGSPDNRGKRGHITQPPTIRTGDQQGFIDKAARALNSVITRDLTAGMAGSAVLGTIGAGYSGTEGFIQGVAVVPVAAMLEKMSRQGRLYRPEQSTDALTYMQDAKRAEYARVMWGVDPRDFQVVGGEIAPVNGILRSSRDPSKLVEEMTQILTVREHFYKSLGVPKSQLDRMPEEFLYNFNSGGMQEQTGMLIRDEIWRAFDARTQYKDIHGRTADDPAFDKNHLDVVGNLQRYNEARAKVMAEKVKNYLSVGKEKVPEVQPDAVITGLQERIDAREKDTGALKLKATEKARTEKATIEATKPKIDAEKSSLESYAQTVKALEDSRNKLAVDFARIPPSPDIDAKLSHLNAQLHKSTPPTGLSIEEQLDMIEPDLQADIARQITALTLPPGKGREGVEASIRKGAEEQAANKRKRLVDRQTKIAEDVTSLEGLKQQMRQQEDALNESQTVVINTEKVMTGLESDFTTLIGWGVTDADLTTKTIEELLTQINHINRANSALGWKSSENSSAEKRLQLIHAIVVARAEQQASKDTSRATSGREMALEDITTRRGITENELRVFTVDQLIRKKNDEFAKSGGARGFNPTYNARWTRQLELAQTEARQKLRVRSEVLSQTSEALTRDAQAQQENIDKIDLSKDIQHLTEVKRLMTGYGPLLEKSQDIASDEKITSFADVTPVDPRDPTLTAAERRLHGIKGYYELLDALFSYKSNSDRDKAFGVAKGLLPPEKMAQLLNRGMELGVPAADERDLTQVLDAMRTGVQDGTKAAGDVRRGLKMIMDRLRDEALAMP